MKETLPTSVDPSSATKTVETDPDTRTTAKEASPLPAREELLFTALKIAGIESVDPPQKELTIRKRAAKLLETGIMPLLPPARREGRAVKPVVLCKTPTRIT